MKRFFEALAGSFFSGQTYAAAALSWRGLGFTFLMLLVLLEAVFFSVTLIPRIQREMSEFFTPIFEQLPEVRIDGAGNASVDVAVPYHVKIKDDETARFLGVIDPSYGAMNVNEVFGWMRQNNVIFLLAQKSLFVYQPNKGEIRVLDLGRWQGTTITRENWKKIQGYLKPLFWAGALIYIVIAGYVGYLLSALFVGGIGLIVNKIGGAGLDYIALVRIACLAMVPGNLLEDALLAFLGMSLGKLEWLILLGYLMFGIRAAGNAKRQMPV